MKSRYVACLLGLFCPTVATTVHACPSDHYEVCAGLCFCVPNSGAVTAPVREVLVQGTAPALQAWLQGSRNSAVGASLPVPPHIAQQLRSFYSQDVINTARYKVGDNGVINAARSIMGTNGNVSAVTLIDVIVFRGPSEAASFPLWVHEMRHVQQFREWGVRDFSIRYTRDADAVERPAYDIEASAKSGPQSIAVARPLPGPQPPFPQQIPVSMPVRFCWTPMERARFHRQWFLWEPAAIATATSASPFRAKLSDFLGPRLPNRRAA